MAVLAVKCFRIHGIWIIDFARWFLLLGSRVSCECSRLHTPCTKHRKVLHRKGLSPVTNATRCWGPSSSSNPSVEALARGDATKRENQ